MTDIHTELHRPAGDGTFSLYKYESRWAGIRKRQTLTALQPVDGKKQVAGKTRN
jgi:hypothetical protein